MSESDLDASKSNDALLNLYRHIAARTPCTFTSLSPDDRRTYFREAKRRNRAKHRAQADADALPATTGNVRAALADAALMILATNAPGADQVELVLGQIFAARPGVPSLIKGKAAAGRLRPQLMRIKP